MKKIIFVIGTGRSGTHLLGRTISSHSLIEGHIEDPALFHPAVNIAVKQDIANPLYIVAQKYRLIKKYKSLLKKSEADFILEKSHPVMWFSEYLKNKIPGSLFVGILRNPFQTVSSMLNHEGVLEWYSKLPQDKPNRFLGITEENKVFFKDLPLESKCTYRWLSHRQELTKLKDVLKDSYLMFEYGDFLEHIPDYLEKLSKFIGVNNRFTPENLKKESMDKWKEFLTKEQVKNIESVISIETKRHQQDQLTG
ncbi:MAG: sulfotransferase [Bacteroidales bacterium]